MWPPPIESIESSDTETVSCCADASADEFVGTLSLPDTPFRIGVTGVDKTGAAYQRLFPTLFRVQT